MNGLYNSEVHIGTFSRIKQVRKPDFGAPAWVVLGQYPPQSHQDSAEFVEKCD